MTFSIDKIRAPSGYFNLKPKRESNHNRTTIITGANGTGKSRLLAALVCQFTSKRSQNDPYINSIVATTSAQPAGAPAKVIAQTFSPFSRFPREHTMTRRLETYVKETDEQYTAIGFTKNYGLYGSVSKDAVGRILRKLFVNPQQASPLGHAMLDLGFEPEIHLEYSRSPSVSSIFFIESNREVLRKSVEKSLNEVLQRRSVGPEVNKLRRELGDKPTDEIIETITNAILVLQNLSPNRTLRTKGFSYPLAVKLQDRLDDHTIDALGALVTLTRLGLLRLSDCVITRDVKENFSSLSSEMSSRIDMTDASSGEQQLLSCLFSIAAESCDNALILIDEPELSLHPAWQTRFLDLLDVVASQYTGCHIFVATHSPLLAQRALELDYDVLQLGHQPEHPKRPWIETVSVEQTLFDVFNVPIRGSNYIPRLALSLVMKAEELPSRTKEISEQLKSIKNIYTQAPVGDKNIERLLEDALDILNDTDEQGEIIENTPAKD